MKVTPLHDRVLVVRIEEEDKTSGGIIIPDSAKEKPQEGKVIAVGAGKLDEDGKRLPLDVKKGDRVLFGKYSGNEIMIDGVEHLIMREEDILAIVK
jgi:chaperonin GroES